MRAEAVALFVAFGLFLLHWQAGRERQMTIRCTMCGSLAGEKHHADCPWGDR